MRFDRLLWHCLQPGEYQFTEENLAVRLSPENNETVLMFRTDSNVFRGSREGVPACDLLFFYRGPASPTPVLLFVELKGSDIEHAETQIGSAFKRVREELAPDCGGGAARAGAVVVLGSSAPADVKPRQKEAWLKQGLPFAYHFGMRGKPPVELRPNLADARKLKRTTPPAPSNVTEPT